MIPIRQGTLLETIPEAERDAVPARGARNPALGRLRTLLVRHYDRAARSSLQGSGEKSALCLRKRSPKLSRGLKNLGECRGGAPKGERAPLADASR
jgi:hypothetical protein